MESDYRSSFLSEPPEQRFSTMTISSLRSGRLSQKYDTYQDFLYGSRNTSEQQLQLNQQQQQQLQQLQQRRRLSSTGEGSADSSTTTSAASSYGEREDGSEEGRPESDVADKEDRRPLDGHITENERLQVETFFKGLKTQVYVSSSLANLYMKSTTDTEWQLKYTGIPVVILDAGEARSRAKRRIQIALAERGTCFRLWHDTIDNLSAYQIAGNAFHTMCDSADHSRQIGFSFDNDAAAHEIWTHIDGLVACPENISPSMPGKKKKKKEKKSPKAAPLPPKSHISQPCCFQHITSVDRDDTTRYYSLKEYLPNAIQNPRIHTLEDI